jgi:HK97 family phage portal protein
VPTDIVLAPTKPRYRVKAVSSPTIITKGEGDFRPGPYYLPYSGGWLGANEGSFLNWWQMGEDVGGLGSSSAMASACVAAYAQTVAMCPGDHWKAKSNGGRERVTTSALSRWLKTPNAYQTISDFLLNGVTNLYDDGNMYALALRNSRYEVIETHLMNPRACNAVVAETGDVFYGLSGNPVIDRMIDYPLMVPARDVLHVRLNTSQHHPLRGESPLMSAARDVAVGNAMALQQLNFYMNQARPGVVLSTDMVLDKDQVQALRDRWDEQSRGLGRGGTPILTAGLKPVPLSSANAENSQLADIMKMSEQRVALAYRVPLQILGIGGAAFNTTESLMQSWLAGALGFALNHVEEAIGRLFGLAGQPDEYLELNTKVLLRSAFKDRVEGLVRGVQGGVFSPDEARETESLPKVKGGFGEEPRVQQQLVPLSAAAAIPAAPGPGAAPPAASVPTPPAKDPVSKADENQEEQQFVIERLQKLCRPLNFQRTE